MMMRSKLKLTRLLLLLSCSQSLCFGPGPALAAAPAVSDGQADGRLQADLNAAEPVSTDDLSGDALNPERIDLKRPSYKALISIDQKIDPFVLDATGSRGIGLADVVDATLKTNLDIGIADYDERIKRTNLLGSYGKFLPDLSLSYQYNYLKGKANVPFGASLEPLAFNNPLIITSAGFKYYGYRGGSVLFG
ncbi:MAG TPA: TolC family protein, partial [Candidatus Obscuribacter sp.]|nr:TolC family protein [Candidatus Obscuribacter sp.]